MGGRGIDHVVWEARDLDAARDRFARLGFTLTPPAVHPFGTGNSLAQFSRSFIELLTVVDEEKITPFGEGFFSFPAFCRDFLEAREGLSMTVLSSNDARADNAQWAARGLRTFDVVDFARKARLPDGTEVEVAFSIAFQIDPAMPGVVFFVCQQHAPQYFWKPQYQHHANGSGEIKAVTLVAEAPAASLDFFTRFVFDGRVDLQDDDLVAETECGTIQVVTPARAEALFPGGCLPRAVAVPHFAAVTIAVADLEACLGVLDTSGTAAHRDAGRIVLPANDLFGCALVFEQAK